MRRLVYDLRPPALDDLGLVPAIRQQAANNGLLAEDLSEGSRGPGRINGKNAIVFTVEASGNLSTLPAAVEVACYRIAQEAIANATRHSGANSCRVRLSLKNLSEQVLEFEVADDGAGMPEDPNAGVGMSSMRDDDRLFGGAGFDGMVGYGGHDLLSGGARGDYIDAIENSDNPGEDNVRGGRGRDFIDAIDNTKDTINSGKATTDRVFYDQNMDTVENCEIASTQYPEETNSLGAR